LGDGERGGWGDGEMGRWGDGGRGGEKLTAKSAKGNRKLNRKERRGIRTCKQVRRRAQREEILPRRLEGTKNKLVLESKTLRDKDTIQSHKVA